MKIVDGALYCSTTLPFHMLSRESETEEATTELYTSDDCCESTASSQFYYKGPADKQDYYNYRKQIALADTKNRSLLGKC